MRGKWIFIALAALLGMVTAYYHFSVFTVFLSFLYLLWLILKLPRHFYFMICTITMAICASLFIWVDTHNTTKLSGKEKEFTGKIKSIPQFDGDRLSFIYQLHTNEKLLLQYKMKSQEEKRKLQDLYVGMECRFTGNLRIPNVARNEHAFDYKTYLYTKKIHWILTPDAISPLQCLPSSSIFSLLSNWRAKQLSYIKEQFPPPTVGIVQALLFGERQEISETVESHFQQFGLTHLLAISGLHVGIVVASVFFLLIRMGVTREISFIILFTIIPFYILLTGATPSVVRAGFMAMLAMISFRFPSKLPPLDVLSIVFLIMILKNPYYLFHIGFQLSFLISFILILSSQSIISVHKSAFKQLWTVSVIAQISAFPFLLFYNYEISLLSLPLNLLYVPLISSFIFPFSFLTFIVSHFSSLLSSVFFSILSTVVTYSFSLLEQMEKLSFFQITFGKPAIWLVMIYYVIMVYFFVHWEKQKRLFNAKPTLLILLVICVHWFSPYFDNEGKITMIDVGQGESILIELPYRKAVYLIDTGGLVMDPKEDWQLKKRTFDIGKDVLTPFLKAKGIRKIDKLLFTHGDWDHIGGAKAIIENFHIEEVLVGAGFVFEHMKEEEELHILQTLKENEIRWRIIKEGDYWKEGDYSFYVLGPTGLENNKNDRSIVLFSYIGGLRWLFTGDIEKEGEQRILTRYPNLKTDVLKIGHHGSKTSTSPSFLDQLSPTYALISAGKYNRYGHPHQEVIKLLTERNISIFRTDVNGSITYKFSGNSGTFQVKLP